jgi:Flp pilus assembly protein TadD
MTTVAVLLAVAIGLAGCSKKAGQESTPETQTAAVFDEPKDVLNKRQKDNELQ